MRAPADADVTKPLAPEDVEKAARRERLARELETDAEVVLSGMRLMNRPRDNAKERFIENFRSSFMIEKFPVIEADLVEESYVHWSQQPPSDDRSMKDVLASEVEAAFRQAGAEPLASSSIVATKILSSDMGSKVGILADVQLHELEVDLVLAHVASLGYRWPPRIALAVARRATIVILNRHLFEGRTGTK